MLTCKNCFQCRQVLKRLVGGGGTNSKEPDVQKGARGLAMLHVFLYFSAVSLFVDCTN